MKDSKVVPTGNVRKIKTVPFKKSTGFGDRLQATGNPNVYNVFDDKSFSRVTRAVGPMAIAAKLLQARPGTAFPADMNGNIPPACKFNSLISWCLLYCICMDSARS